MKYKKEFIKNLDTKTIDFCARWVWDTMRRHRMTEDAHRTKAQREYAHAENNGLEFAFDLLRVLKEYNTGKREIAEEITLYDDTIRGLSNE